MFNPLKVLHCWDLKTGSSVWMVGPLERRSAKPNHERPWASLTLATSDWSVDLFRLAQVQKYLWKWCLTKSPTEAPVDLFVFFNPSIHGCCFSSELVRTGFCPSTVWICGCCVAFFLLFLSGIMKPREMPHEAGGGFPHLETTPYMIELFACLCVLLAFLFACLCFPIQFLQTVWFFASVGTNSFARLTPD